jgi:putative peptidoglycan lipid II flippase
MEFPMGLLGAALGTILLPSLAKHHATRSAEDYSRLLDWGLRMTMLLAVPAAAALALLAVPLISTLFQYGAFSEADTLATRSAVVAYSIGLVPLILVKVLAPGFYGRQNIRTPVKVAIVSLVSTQVLNLLLIGPLRHAGLALAISLGACVNAGLLFVLLRRNGIYSPQSGWLRFVLKLALAVLAMSAVLWFGAGSTEVWLRAAGSERVLHLAWVVVAGAACYFAVLWAVGFRPSQFSHRGVE